MLSFQHDKPNRPEVRVPTPGDTPCLTPPPPGDEEGCEEQCPEAPDRPEVRDPPPTTGPVG